MAQRRMFSLKIVDTDLFLEMPATTQNLYFHLSMRADDDGFISSPNKIMKFVNCTKDDMKILVAKQYVIPFESGVCVIKHWKIHNYIQKDRREPTIYKEEKSILQEVDKQYVIGLDTKCIQNGYIGKDRLELGEVSVGKSKKDIRHKYGEYKNVLLTDKQFEKLSKDFPNIKDLIKLVDEGVQMKGYKYKDFNLVIRKWAKTKNGSNNGSYAGKVKIETVNKEYGW